MEHPKARVSQWVPWGLFASERSRDHVLAATVMSGEIHRFRSDLKLGRELMKPQFFAVFGINISISSGGWNWWMLLGTAANAKCNWTEIQTTSSVLRRWWLEDSELFVRYWQKWLNRRKWALQHSQSQSTPPLFPQLSLSSTAALLPCAPKLLPSDQPSEDMNYVCHNMFQWHGLTIISTLHKGKQNSHETCQIQVSWHWAWSWRQFTTC